MKTLFAAALFLTSGTLALAGSWETSAFRPPAGGLVKPGMTMEDVLADAGEPMTKRATEATIVTPNFLKRIVTRETWVYRGSDGVYAVAFEQGQVRQIVVTPDR